VLEPVRLLSCHRLTLVNIRQYTSLCNSDMPQKLVQFLVIPNRKLEMTGNYASLLVVASGIACQFQNLGRKVLENSSKVDRCA